LSGNAGIAALAECINVNQNNFNSLLDFVKYEWIDLTIVGPEEPLSKGIVDLFEKEGRKILDQQGSCTTGIKQGFSKDLMKSYGIPTAEYRSSPLTCTPKNIYGSKAHQ